MLKSLELFLFSTPLTCIDMNNHHLFLSLDHKVYTRSGYPSLDARRGRRSGSEYQLAPRALILRRDHAAVQSVSQLRRLLRSNGYDTTTATTADSKISGRSKNKLPPPLNAGMQGRTEDFGDPFASDSPWSAVRLHTLYPLFQFILFLCGGQ